MLALYMNDLDNKIYLVESGEGRTTLSFLQDLVEGLVECVSLGDDTDLWVNEEGLYRNDFRLNGRASYLAGDEYHLVGPAVLTGVTSQGETVSIHDDFIALVESVQGKKVYSVEEVTAIRHQQVDELRLQGVKV